MESVIKEALRTTKLVRTGQSGGGCINDGEAYETDQGTVFVKRNKDPKSRIMFDGELAGLNAIIATGTVRAPRPYTVLDNPKGGCALVMEYLEMSHLSKFSKKLGTDLAKMHLHNKALLDQIDRDSGYVGPRSSDNETGVTQFGFETTTCCGFLPLNNTWGDDWITFYARQRLEEQIVMAEKKYGDREVGELWSQLQIKLPQIFKDIDVMPSLLHGDLWGGNVSEVESEAVIFDPGAFYGHSEFELGIAGMFGGFNTEFYKAYHNLIPKASGFEVRKDLYQLFHYLNHWNHFGGGYRGSSISIMKRLLKTLK